MPTRRPSEYRNLDWGLHCSDDSFKNRTWTHEHIMVVVLCDIRAELQAINARLDCGETRSIPRTLKAIARKMPTPRPRRKVTL